MTIEPVGNVLYPAKTLTVGGRHGISQSSDGRLAISLSPPGALGRGTNPEQLLAARWSACFGGALAMAARRIDVALPSNLGIDAEVDLGASERNYFIQARLKVLLPGIDGHLALALVSTAHEICPYSKATRNKRPPIAGTAVTWQ